jgi:S-adenosylmethionine decarboxylase
VSGAAGQEWLVEARGCAPEALRDLPRLRALAERILVEMDLRVLGEPRWHQFGGEAGVTGLYLLAESHLALHTFPEHGLATFNLYCCRPRAAWPWRDRLQEALAAKSIEIRQLERG